MRSCSPLCPWSADASWFTYNLTWDNVDHQTANGNAIEFYRKGEWLTMQRIGYDLDYATSDNLNTLAIQNDKPARDADDYRMMLWDRGSQWLYNLAGDPPPPLVSFNDQFVYAQGDATNLYNSTYELLTDVQHASRSVVWLKPDTLVVYDRAETKSSNRFKRFWLSLPANGVVSGNRTTMKTAKAQQLFVTTLLPAQATISVQAAQDEKSGPPANNAPMTYRLKIEAAGSPNAVRFLNVLQGVDAGASAALVQMISSTAGTAFTGVTVANNTVVMFVNSLGQAFAGVTYTIPSGVTRQVVTGLQPVTSYNVMTQPSATGLTVMITPGNGAKTDSGGVLVIGG